MTKQFEKMHNRPHEEEPAKRVERKIVETMTGQLGSRKKKEPFYTVERETGRPLLHDEPEERKSSHSTLFCLMFNSFCL